MMEDVLVKLNVGLLWLKLHSTRRGLFLLDVCNCEIKCRIAMAKDAFNKNRIFLFYVCTCEINCRIAMAKAAFNKKRTPFT